MKTRFRRAQALIESVVAIGILALVLTAAIALIVMSTSIRQRGFDRRKANQLANMVMEEYVAKSQRNADKFWSETSNLSNKLYSGYSDYRYSVTFGILGSSYSPNCSTSDKNCMEIVVGVGWSGKNPENIEVRRFFSR